MGKIIHGNKSFGYAPINVSGNTYTFGSPVLIPGLVSTSVSVEQDETKVYADDSVFAKVKGAKVRGAEVHLRNIPKEYAEYLGYHINANGSLSDTGEFQPHCIFFETEEENEGATTRTLHYLYNVTASTPTIESKTDQESVEASEITITYSALDSQFVVDDAGSLCQYAELTRTSANASTYDTFTSAVIKPTTAITSI